MVEVKHLYLIEILEKICLIDFKSGVSLFNDIKNIIKKYFKKLSHKFKSMSYLKKQNELLT